MSLQGARGVAGSLWGTESKLGIAPAFLGLPGPPPDFPAPNWEEDPRQGLQGVLEEKVCFGHACLNGAVFVGTWQG